MATTMMSLSNGDVGGARVNNGGGSARAGQKRAASDSDLGDGDRFNKRFNLLTLGAPPHGNSNLYVGIDNAPSNTTTPAPRPPPTIPDNDSMQLDDTRDRVYIHDLDAELADVESDEEKLIFLPDIEKKLSKIPRQVLEGHKNEDQEGQELVLYSLPKSLTVDEGHDSVRKAIIEARQRARDKAVEEARHQDMNCKYDQSTGGGPTETAHGYTAGYEDEMDLDDMMDMD